MEEVGAAIFNFVGLWLARLIGVVVGAAGFVGGLALVWFIFTHKVYDPLFAVVVIPGGLVVGSFMAAGAKIIDALKSE